ncbi:MAG TPA: hypothetical protein VMT93_04985 [Gemmatimonadaceae bacterium]|nr:hypothetical protein [Gemmatimonadaceae bacterium]
MSDPAPTLPHLPFFERLAALEEKSPAFRAFSAGLVTLRFVDAWVVEGPRVAAADSWSLRAVREAIEAMDAGHGARALLRSVVDAIDPRHAVARVALVTPRLIAYARALQLDGEWALAADVHRTVIAHADLEKDPDSVITAFLQLGACMRTLARWDEAMDAYDGAGQAAAEAGDVMNMLKARVGEANVLMDRGSLPEAEQILDETIADAEQLGLRDLRSAALHDRAAAAHRRGDYEAAVAMQYLALQDAQEGTSRDRVLADLAASFFEIGLRSAARDANLVLAATAQEQFTRWQATINLMEIAASDRYEPVFEQYRRELAPAALPPTLSAWYYLYMGQGYRVFDRTEQAKAALERALALAEEHRINQVVFLAENALSDLRDGARVHVVTAAAPTPMVEAAAQGVRRLRELAGIRE